MSQSTFIFLGKNAGSLAHVLQIIDAYLERISETKGGLSALLPATLPYTALALVQTLLTCSQDWQKGQTDYR